MSDKLEKFIRENKNQMDGFEAPELVWEKIETGLNVQQNKNHKQGQIRALYKLIKVAAVLILIFSGGYFLVSYQKNEANKLSNISPKYAQKATRFASLIEMKQEEVKTFAKQEPQLYRAFVQEQNKLENEYNSLKIQLNNTPNQDRVVKAMIRNLQAQISLLNQQLSIIEEIKQLKNDKNENKSI